MRISPTGRRRSVQLLALGLALLTMLPFLWLVTMSVKTNDDIFAFPPRLLFAPTLENYASLWSTGFRQALLNSIAVSTISTLLALLVGVPGAYALSRITTRLEGPLSLLILASRMAPPIAFTIPYFLAYRYAGLLDTRTGLVLVYLTFNISLVVWLMRSFFDATPRALEEAAWIDGASLWQGFLRIILPISAPGHRGHRDPVLPLQLERLLLRADPDPEPGDDGAGRSGELHELRGLGMGSDRRRRHPDHAAGADLLGRGAEIPDPGNDSGCGQGVTCAPEVPPFLRRVLLMRRHEMRRSRFTEEEIIGVLREQEAGDTTAGVCRRHGISQATWLVARIGGAPADRQSLPPFMRCAYMPAVPASAFD
jgi:ABC-type spermidine/putrescine transport system permease subunit II